MAIFNTVYGGSGGGGGWQPGANTIAYYPLDTTNTVNDLSGNNRTLSNYNGVEFGTYAGVDCAYFSGNRMLLYNVDFPARGNGDYSMSCWMYTTSNNKQPVIAQGNSDNTALVILLNNGYIDPNIAQVTLNTWHYLCYVVESGYLTIYLDGVSVYNSSYNVNGGKGLGIGRKTYLEGEMFLGYISNVILEDMARSSTNVTKYYNQTKSAYGL